MNTELNIYEMAMRVERDLRDSRLERARLLAEAGVASSLRAHSGSPLRVLIEWATLHARSLTHRQSPALQDTTGNSRAAAITNR